MILYSFINMSTVLSRRIFSANFVHCSKCFKLPLTSFSDYNFKRIEPVFSRQYSNSYYNYYHSSYDSRFLIKNKILSHFEPINVNYNQRSCMHTWLEAYRDIFLSISESAPVIATQNFLVNFHDTSGLPWWATIAVSTAIFRISLTLPLSLYQQYILAKVENLKLELPDLIKGLQKEVEVATLMYKWTPQMATYVFRRSLKKHWRLMIERENCHPAKAFIMIAIQFPMWVLFSMSIRNLVSMRPFFDEGAKNIFSQLKSEGFLWMTDLTVADTTMIVPCSLCLVSLTIVEVNRLMHHHNEQTTYKKVITVGYRCFALLTLPLGYIVPSCLSFYWLTSATVGLCQNLIVLSPKLKSFVGIPPTPTLITNPYNHLWKGLRISLKLSPKE